MRSGVVVRFFIATGPPEKSFAEKVTVGALPATPLSTRRMSNTRPARESDSVFTMWAPLIEASNSSSPCGMWHMAHSLSDAIGRFEPEWFLPVAKFTLSWHDPQAARLGFVK